MSPTLLKSFHIALVWVAYWTMIGIQTSCHVTKSCLYGHDLIFLSNEEAKPKSNTFRHHAPSLLMTEPHRPPSPPFPQIPEEMNRCRNSYVEQALLPRRLEDLAGEEGGQGGYGTYLRDSLDALLKDAKDKFKGYDSCSTPEHAELAYRKVRTLVVHVWKDKSLSRIMCSVHMAAFSVFVRGRGWIHLPQSDSNDIHER